MAKPTKYVAVGQVVKIGQSGPRGVVRYPVGILHAEPDCSGRLKHVRIATAAERRAFRDCRKCNREA